jgi:hypothetical protein
MRLVTVLFCWFLLASLSKAQDFQQWNEVDLTAEWRKVDLIMPMLARTDSHLPNPQLAATGVIANYPLRKHLILTGAYLYADLPQLSDHVHLPVIALTPAFRVNRFSLADMNRFEKLIGYTGSPVRYRNKVFLDRPFGAGEQWHFFVTNEIFFNLSAGNWNQNRFQAGAGKRLSSRLFLDMYYLERVSNGAAESTNVLGTVLTVGITPIKEGEHP